MDISCTALVLAYQSDYSGVGPKNEGCCQTLIGHRVDPRNWYFLGEYNSWRIVKRLSLETMFENVQTYADHNLERHETE